MQTAIEKLAAQQRLGPVRIVYSPSVAENRIVPAPVYWDADFICRDEATLDRLLAKHGILHPKGANA